MYHSHKDHTHDLPGVVHDQYHAGVDSEAAELRVEAQRPTNGVEKKNEKKTETYREEQRHIPNLCPTRIIC